MLDQFRGHGPIVASGEESLRQTTNRLSLWR
jgi:hypothetical protein